MSIASENKRSTDDIQVVELPAQPSKDGESSSNEEPVIQYRSYKRRFFGLFSMILLAGTSGMVLPWFGPIATNLSAEFGFSLNQINWFANAMSFTFLPVSLCVPLLFTKFGIRYTCYIGAVFMILGAWVRYAGTASSLSRSSAYGLIMLGEIFGACGQPLFQILGPKYSETWFNLKERTTATMLMTVANPVGAAIAQIISPLFATSKLSIFYLAIITTVVVPFVFLIFDQPPTPPTYAAAQAHPTLASLTRAMTGKEPRDEPTYMTWRERCDFVILMFEFGIFVGTANAFGALSAQVFIPYGYSDHTAGFLGATLLLVGLFTSIIAAPIFDRVLTHHLARTSQVMLPVVAVAWLTLIWAVRPHNTGALYAIMAILGGISLTLLPVALELAAEITRNADGSSALMWFSGSLFTVTFVLIEGALRASPEANPPMNMHRALIFQGVFLCASVSFIFLLKGKQVRRERDESKVNDCGEVGVTKEKESGSV